MSPLWRTVCLLSIYIAVGNCSREIDNLVKSLQERFGPWKLFALTDHPLIDPDAAFATLVESEVNVRFPPSLEVRYLKSNQ